MQRDTIQNGTNTASASELLGAERTCTGLAVRVTEAGLVTVSAKDILELNLRHLLNCGLKRD